LSLVLIAYVTAVGWGILALLRVTPRPADILVSPGFGVACVVLPTVLLNRLNIPVGKFALALGIVLLGLALFGLLRRASEFKGRDVLAFLPFIALAFLLTGWPLFVFGVSWVSYANDDMANYTLGALRFVDHGYFDVPVFNQFIHNIDIPQFGWFLHDLDNERFGVDEFLAFVASVSKVSTLEVFMPTTVALHVAMVAGTAGLIYRGGRNRAAALLATFLLACSSLATFGVDYQLIAQVAGMAVLFCAMYFVCDLPVGSGLSRLDSAREVVIVSIALGAVGEIYPEVLPFVILPAVGLFAFRLAKREVKPVSLLKWGAAISVGFLIATIGYLRNLTWVLFARVISTAGAASMNTGSTPIDGEHPLLFPFYLIPTGVANYFGIYPLTTYPADPWLSLGIVVGFCLAGIVAFATLVEIRRGEPIAWINGLLGIMALLLFFKMSDFGLYKVAMYSQPFMLGTLSLWWIRLCRLDRPRERAAAASAVSA
jgi:hypothetical protein